MHVAPFFCALFRLTSLSAYLRPAFLCAAILLLFSISARAQGTITGPAKVCLGSVSNFSYVPPSGQTASSYNWDFGDGNGSTLATPSHNYTAQGSYTVQVQVSLSGGGSATASLNLTVYALPQPYFYPGIRNDSCLNRNHMCFIDTSSPAVSGQTIVRRVFVWGDGSFRTHVNPKKYDSLCHVYQVADKYTVRMELTDNQGCINSVSRDINIIQTVTAAVEVKKRFSDCNTALLCLRNKSTGVPHNQAKYRWYADTTALDTNIYATSDKCVPYTQSRSGIVTLIAWFNPVCRDTIIEPFDFIVDPLPDTLFQDDTLFCFSFDGLNRAYIRDVARDNINWFVDNKVNPLSKQAEHYFETKRAPGRYPVRVEIVRGSCVKTLRDTFTVIGPQARFRLIDGKQCFSSRDVFMVEESLGIQRENCKFRWTLTDPFGENCIQQRTKDINKYKNCNVSLDWFNKHRYTQGSGSNLLVHLLVTDTVTGCVDSAKQWVNMNYCSPLLAKDTHRVCQGRYFADNSLPPYPEYVSLDSGKNWLKFPLFVDTNYFGYKKISYIFKTDVPFWAEHFGDDSIKQHPDTTTYYDTLINYNILDISLPRRDSLSWKIYGKCKPYRFSLYFGNRHFKKGEKLFVNWSDFGNIELECYSDTIIDSVVHIYQRSGSYRVTVITNSVVGCESITRIDAGLGKLLNAMSPKFINCSYDRVCFNGAVRDALTNFYWQGNTQGNYVRWWFPDTSALVTRWNPCVKFDTGGMRPFKMIAYDSLGCIDTLIDTIFIQDLRANVRQSAFQAYCSELKLFYDSSAFNRNPAYRKFLTNPPYLYLDSIMFWRWQFGDGTFSSQQRNPLQSLNASLDSIPAALAVQTNSGCYDTLRFHIRIKGPKPYFTIEDTIGCGQLQAVFHNRSRQSSSYLWKFGDSLQSSLQRTDTLPVTFNYNKPGRYLITLTAYDSVYSPISGQTRYCVSTFPDPDFQKDTQRAVLVLPFRSTGIQGPDTICARTPFNLFSQSDTLYDTDRWDLGDSTFMSGDAPYHISHSYLKEGVYTVRLKPEYNDSLYNHCVDSAVKVITVLEVSADFDIDPASVAPVFRFSNRSLPAGSQLNWDFGHTDPGNTSTDENPSKDYGNDTGTYTVCLIASNTFGCRDTICKTVYNDYLNEFGLYNVFTPGQKDKLNDVYDIVIQGEELYELYIYDRWGELVFEGNKDIEPGEEGNWNGKRMNTGAECPAGTYYYIFRYSLRSSPGELKTIQGVIRLIR